MAEQQTTVELLRVCIVSFHFNSNIVTCHWIDTINLYLFINTMLIEHNFHYYVYLKLFLDIR